MWRGCLRQSRFADRPKACVAHELPTLVILAPLGLPLPHQNITRSRITQQSNRITRTETLQGRYISYLIKVLSRGSSQRSKERVQLANALYHEASNRGPFFRFFLLRLLVSRRLRFIFPY